MCANLSLAATASDPPQGGLFKLYDSEGILVHERTQRAIARLLFVFCCALPTGITLLCVSVTWTPWYHYRKLRGYENEISRETGLIVRMEDFRRTTPSSIHFSSVRLVDPETLHEVATVREVDWVTRDDEVSIFLHQPELQSSELHSAWRLIHDRFLCRPERTLLPVRFAANDLTIHSRTGAVTMRDVDAWLRAVDRTVEATIQCVSASNQTDAPISITATRDRSDVPATKWMLNTAGTPLPCSALAEYLPVLAVLGNEAEFVGTMRWQSDANHVIVNLDGSRFDHVTLDRLFERQSHRLTGKATIKLERCRIDPRERHSDIVGSIRATDGRIGRSLLLSAQEHLGFQVRPFEGDGDIPFDLIELGFDINSTRLVLKGNCQQNRGLQHLDPGTVMCLDGHALVRSTDQDLDALAVVQVIAPPHSVMVPLSNQTDWVTNIFVPPSRPLPAGETHIRSARSYQGGETIEQPDVGAKY